MTRKEFDEFGNPVNRAANYQAAKEAREERAEPGEPAGTAIPGLRPEDIAARADAAVDRAVARGDFDNLAYAGKPLPDLGATLDPDWWVQGLIQRENLTGLGPPAIMLRKEDAELDGELDKLAAESRVREMVEDFNTRIIDARRQLLGGPPVVTKLRDADQEVQRWQGRRAGRIPASSAAREASKQNWWQRLFRHNFR